ncbi:methionine adenosyltransferase [Eubacteriales bacterium OttesenSCG-928-M02]|nr:methionine adenosyltransferase [Eubacteriales bacterium OttesenSCG-928-M02]
MAKRLFTSESVTEGHPDKLCDQISDGVLDAILAQDPMGRVACEALSTTGLVMVAGEISTSCYVEIPAIVRDVVLNVGYTSSDIGFDGNSCSVLTSIHEQSGDIAMGVDDAFETRGKGLGDIGAGDQGLMFGYACNETEELMPMPITLAHNLTRKMSEIRKSGLLSYLRPDGKSQVTVEYEDNVPIRVDKIVLSTQHHPDVDLDTIRRDMIEQVANAVIPAHLLDEDTQYLINPTGRFVTGGPMGDTGLTGRKIIVDTYGGYARHGGGCFSGKDPTKVDRSACYAARHVAKNIVAAGLAQRCEIQLAYAIGVAKPLSICVDTFGTGRVPDSRLVELINLHFDLRPHAIIERLSLRAPIYQQVASYGHFGRPELNLPWEDTSYAAALLEDA